MTTEPFEVQLKYYSRLAEQHLEQLRAHLVPVPEVAQITEALLGYVRCKFMLEQEECASDELKVLSQASISKVAKIPRGDIANQDISMNCAGISSVETKKLLLIIAMQRSLGIKIPPDATPNIQTVTELAEQVRAQLLLREHSAGPAAPESLP